MPFLRSFIAGDLIFGVVMIAILVALAIWGVGRVMRSQDVQSVEATAPSIVDVLGGTSFPTPTLDLTFVPVEENPLDTTATLAAQPTPAERKCSGECFCGGAGLCADFSGWGSSF